MEKEFKIGDIVFAKTKNAKLKKNRAYEITSISDDGSNILVTDIVSHDKISEIFKIETDNVIGVKYV